MLFQLSSIGIHHTSSQNILHGFIYTLKKDASATFERIDKPVLCLAVRQALIP